MKRVATVRCTGPCEWFVVTRASYENTVALLPIGARTGGLAAIMRKFWNLVTGPDGTNAEVVRCFFSIFSLFSFFFSIL